MDYPPSHYISSRTTQGTPGCRDRHSAHYDYDVVCDGDDADGSDDADLADDDADAADDDADDYDEADNARGKMEK